MTDIKRARILLADDHTMICDGLRKLLEPEYEVIGCVGDGRALVKTALDLKPDLALVDVGMPLLNGLDAGRELRKLMPRLKLIFLTMNPDAEVASEAGRKLEPASVFISRKTQRLYVRQIFEPILEVPVTIQDSGIGISLGRGTLRRTRQQAIILPGCCGVHNRRVRIAHPPLLGSGTGYIYR